jgi:hypothetical protein
MRVRAFFHLLLFSAFVLLSPVASIAGAQTEAVAFRFSCSSGENPPGPKTPRFTLEASLKRATPGSNILLKDLTLSTLPYLAIEEPNLIIRLDEVLPEGDSDYASGLPQVHDLGFAASCFWKTSVEERAFADWRRHFEVKLAADCLGGRGFKTMLYNCYVSELSD